MPIQRVMTQMLALLALSSFAVAGYFAWVERSTMSGAGILITLAALGIMCVAAGIGVMIVEASLLKDMRVAASHLMEMKGQEEKQVIEDYLRAQRESST